MQSSPDKIAAIIDAIRERLLVQRSERGRILASLLSEQTTTGTSPVLLRVRGAKPSFTGVYFLELALSAASAVGRITEDDDQAIGTGVLIGEGLFLTNHHVLPNAGSAAQARVEFEYELSVDETPKTPTSFSFAPEKFFFTSSEDDLDFAIVAIGERIAGEKDLQAFGSCPLFEGGDAQALGDFVNIVQHPEGAYKQVVLRENRIVAKLERVLHYAADTLPGSSGAPVFNDRWELVALHHWGEAFTETVLPDGGPAQIDVNEGIRIDSIIRHLRQNKEVFTEEQWEWLSSAFQASERNPIEAMRSKRKRVSIDRNYATRNGYDPDFLPGFRLPLPSLREDLREQAAEVRNRRPEDDPYELKYQHFSIVMNAARRMAFFTAANIDGISWMHVDRATGRAHSSGAEKREPWFVDPRIDAEAQCEDELYRNQQPHHLLDRGHLVRRQDPTWGTPARASRASADTFHFPNCTPQHFTFNQSTEYWQGIEGYVLDNVKAEREKVTVLTGPVFADDDPVYRYIRIPRAFWKILVRVQRDRLLATALLADQSEKLAELEEKRAHGFDQLGAIAQFQTSVAEIERLTGLDFGPLRDCDTFAAVAPEQARRPLGSFDEITLDPLFKG